MIGRIRRIIRGPADGFDQEKGDWPLEVELGSETRLEEDSPPTTEADFEPSAELEEGTDYYTNLVRASIASGGKFGKREIPIQWLRMILAGLEGRDTGIEMLLNERRSEAAESDIEIGDSPGQSFYDSFANLQ